MPVREEINEAEKYLKAFLISRDTRFGKTHDLSELLQMCLVHSLNLEAIRNELNILLPYAIDFRYPGKSATLEEAKETVSAMKKVRKVLRKAMKLY